jgi:phage terminase small subunit
MGVPKKLTEMQIKFAHEIVTNEGRKTATQCAIDAGYEKDSAHVRASELQNPKLFPLVVQYIGKIRSEYLKKYDVTFESHISELAKLRDESRGKGAWSAAINAEVARGKAAGLYVEQKIIRTGKLDDLSEDELDKRIAETLDQYSPILEGISADQLKSEIKSNQEQIRLEGNKKAAEPLPPLKNVTDYSESSSSESSSESSSNESSS